MSDPAIAVVIPTFNSTSTIARTLDSIEMPPRGAELLLVDDHSDDISALRAIVARYPGARLIEKPARTNAADSRAIGLAAARAPIVFFLDADDRFEHGHIARRLSMFAGGDCGVVFGRFCLDDGRTLRAGPAVTYAGEDIADYIFVRGGDCRSSTIAVDRRRLRGTTFDSLLAQHQDWGFALAMQRNGEVIAFDPHPGVVIDIDRPGRMSGRVRVDASVVFLDRWLHGASAAARRGFLLGRLKAALKLDDRTAARRFHTLLRRESPPPVQRALARALVMAGSLGLIPLLRRLAPLRRTG